MSEATSPSRPRALESVGRWEREADVVIVGYGGAGACAAIEAAGLGVRVLVLEAASGGGGSTAISGGHLYLGGGTRVQRAVGLEDTPEEMFRYLRAGGDGPDAAKGCAELAAFVQAPGRALDRFNPCAPPRTLARA